MSYFVKWVVVCVALGLTLSACRKQPRPANLAIITDLEGTTAPCGCNARQLGGIDHMASALDALGQTTPASLLVVGSTFFTFDQSPASLATQELTKSRTIAKWLKHLKPGAIVPGPFDRSKDANVLEDLREDVTLPVLWQLPTQSMIKLDNLQVGVIGVATQPDVAAINQAAVALRQTGAVFIVVLISEDSPTWRQQVPQLKDVQVVVQANSGIPPFAQALENTVMVGAGSRGEYVGLVHLVPQGTGPWKFFADGEQQRKELQDRQRRMEEEAAKLPDGPAKAARLARARDLGKEVQSVASVPPDDAPYFTWETIAVQDSLVAAPWAKTLLAGFNHDLCKPTLAETAKRDCAPAARPNEAYVGSDSCKACHMAAWEQYGTTKHAHAWATLTDAGRDCDLSCVGCHTVGFEKPGGFCRLQDAPKFANVGCESCHGPSAGHLKAPQDRAAWGEHFVRNPDTNVCATCHTPKHSDQYTYATYRPRIIGLGHGVPMETKALPVTPEVPEPKAKKQK